MNDKMRRFLTSIGIENIERFDLDFDLVTRNQYNRNKIDMLIVKEVPWTYELLEEFQNHLETIKYPYSIKFNYLRKPTASDDISNSNKLQSRVNSTVCVVPIMEQLSSVTRCWFS